MFQCGNSGCDADGVARQRSGLVDAALRREFVHDRRLAADRPDGESAADDLAQRGQVGFDIVHGLGAAVGQPEPVDDLVKDQQRFVSGTKRTQLFQKCRLRKHRAHIAGDRLDDDRANLAGVLGKELFDGIGVVVGGQQGVPGKILRYARTGGSAQRHQAGPGADEHVVDVAMVAADELDDLVPAGGAAGQADGGHDRLGAAADQPDLVDGVKRLNDHLGQLRFQCGRDAVAGAGSHGLFDLGQNGLVSVAEDHRAPGQAVVDVAVAVFVVEEGPLGFLDKDRGGADALEGADGTVDTAGDDFLCFSKELCVLFIFHDIPFATEDTEVKEYFILFWRRCRFPWRWSGWERPGTTLRYFRVRCRTC